MFENNPHHKDILDEGYKSLQKGILLFGGSLVALGILIFMFPALIGFMFAAFILFVGVLFLAVAWKIWRFKKHLDDSGEGSKPFKASFRTEGPNYTHRRFFVVIK